jgi:hypothetical protein
MPPGRAAAAVTTEAMPLGREPKPRKCHPQGHFVIDLIQSEMIIVPIGSGNAVPI